MTQPGIIAVAIAGLVPPKNDNRRRLSAQMRCDSFGRA